MKVIKFIDLFCGIGGFHYAMKAASQKLGYTAECVFASDIDQKCRETYAENHGQIPFGDITKFDENKIPDHDILLGGFPCQAFSIIGGMKGFKDTRGTLFFDIARILDAKKPKGFVLENVKQLVGHNKGETLKTILAACSELGYKVEFKVLNALDFGLPQKRERIFIVGWKENLSYDFDFDLSGIKHKTLDDILESTVGNKFYASGYIQGKRQTKVKPEQITHGRRTIWHENKSGNISAHEFSCALRAGASYNYLLVDGIRRMTGRELLRLQGFPDAFKAIGSYSDIRKQTGNALPVPIAEKVIANLIQNNLVDLENDTYAETKTSFKVAAAL